MKTATALLTLTCAIVLATTGSVAELQNIEITEGMVIEGTAIHPFGSTSVASAPLIGSGFDEWQVEGSEQPNRGWLNVGDAAQSKDDPRLLTSSPGSGVLLNGKTGAAEHLISYFEHRDIQLHVEFMVPKGSNSGVYLQGRYEIQIFDSWGKEHPQHYDCGGIYGRWVEGDAGSDEAITRIAAWEKEHGRKLTEADGDAWRGYEGHPPSTNASKPPGQWQSFDITFRAPRYDDDGIKTENARFVKVVHNGVTIHENVELTGPTRAPVFEDEQPTGPLMFQGDHGPVAFRNITVTLMSDAPGGSISK